MRLVVISDPLESGRQIHSDGGDFLRGVVSHHAHLGDVRLVSPTEDEVADELYALDPRSGGGHRAIEGVITEGVPPPSHGSVSACVSSSSRIPSSPAARSIPMGVTSFVAS